MKLLSLCLIIYFCFVAIDGTIDCSIYSKEIDIINLNPFFVRPYFSSTLTSVDLYSQFQINTFYIINDVNPSSNLFCLKNLRSLRLMQTNVPDLTDIKNLQSLTQLSIESDKGSIGEHLPSEIGQLTSLYMLELINITKLKDLPSEIENLIQLQSLSLKQLPNLESVPDLSLGKLTELRSLYMIDVPKLSTLPKPMENLQKLNSFTLTNTNLTELTLQNLKGLVSLEIASNLAMKSIQIENMPIMDTLQIRNTNMQLASINIKDLLKIQSLRFNSLAELQSAAFENLSKLTIISLSGNRQLNTLKFINTPSVKELNLSNCQLTSFPESILLLTSLETLDMQSNQLSSLPTTLSIDLPNLKVLNLNSNQFQGNIIQPPLISIQQLYMNKNLLNSLEGIGEYKSLEQLTFDSNQITSIPLEIMKLSSKLQSLSINNNSLTQIPYQMVNMRNLKSFYAANNGLSPNEKVYLSNLFRQTSIQLKLI